MEMLLKAGTKTPGNQQQQHESLAEQKQSVSLWRDEKCITSVAESVIAFVTLEEIWTEIQSSKEESSSISDLFKKPAF